MTKVERLIQMEYLLMTHPEGLHRAEIARRIGVHRSTIGRYVDEISLRLPVWENGKKIGIDSEASVNGALCSAWDGLALYLCAQAFALITDLRVPQVAAILRKLAATVGKTEPLLGAGLTRCAEKIDGRERRDDSRLLLNLSVLVEAWISGEWVRVTCHDGDFPNDKLMEVADVAFVRTRECRISLHVTGYEIVNGARRTEPLPVAVSDIVEIEICVSNQESGERSRGMAATPYVQRADSPRTIGFRLIAKSRVCRDMLTRLGGRDLGSFHGIDGWRLFALESTRPVECLPALMRFGWDLEIIAPGCARIIYQVRTQERLMQN